MKLRTALLGLSLLAVLPSAELRAGPVPMVERAFVIAIDPGHGGSNGGCVAFDGHAREKDVTLALAHDLAAVLSKRLPHARVVLTRSGDETVTLSERVARANAAGADLMLSVHANASEGRNQTGFETYVLQAELADREAARSTSPGAPGDATRAQALAMVQQLAQAGHRARAVGFAWRVQQEQAERFPERPDRGVRQARFDVLMGAQMPAVLFEAGFLDHPEEGPRMLDGGQRALVVDGLADAVLDYYREHARQR